MINSKMLFLMQICDSTFPIGNFSHSFGLETYIQSGKVHDKETMDHWLNLYFSQQMVHFDGLGCFLAIKAIRNKDQEEFRKVGELLHAASLAKEVREANQKIGTQFIRLIKNLYSDECINNYDRDVRLKRVPAHCALVFAIIGHHLNLTPEETVVAYLYAAASSLIQNGVRGIPLGQTAGQQLLYALTHRLNQIVAHISQLTVDDLGATPPGLELAQMQHEDLTVRIFMS